MTLIKISVSICEYPLTAKCSLLIPEYYIGISKPAKFTILATNFIWLLNNAIFFMIYNSFNSLVISSRFGAIIISTRLFIALPVAVEFSAIGKYSPLPEAVI